MSDDLDELTKAEQRGYANAMEAERKLHEDRIEQLERERDEWIAHAKNAIWSDSEELKLSETKLAKAMEALREMHKKSMWLRGEQSYREFARYVKKITRAVLAELEGKDEQPS